MTATYKNRVGKEVEEKLARFLHGWKFRFKYNLYGWLATDNFYSVSYYKKGTIVVGGGDAPNDYKFYRELKSVIDS